MDLLKNPPPSYFDENLTPEVLSVFANNMLDVFSKTVKALSSPDDDNYTVFCTLFGRCKNRFKRIIRDGSVPGPIAIEDSSNKFSFKIGCTSDIRFFKEDDYLNPKKPHFFKQSHTYDFFEIADDNSPVFWRFILVPAKTDEEETFVAFVGFNRKMQPVSCWTSNNVNRFIFDPDAVLPEPAELKSVSIDDLLFDEKSDKAQDF